MAIITALDGTPLAIDDNAIALLTGPDPGDPGRWSHIIGPAPDPIVTAEDAGALVARLHRKQALAQLTRPDGSPVWFSGAAVSLIRLPSTFDIPPGETVGAVLEIGGHHQAVIENPAAAKLVIDAHGGHL